MSGTGKSRWGTSQPPTVNRSEAGNKAMLKELAEGEW